MKSKKFKKMKFVNEAIQFMTGAFVCDLLCRQPELRVFLKRKQVAEAAYGIVNDPQNRNTLQAYADQLAGSGVPSESVSRGLAKFSKARCEGWVTEALMFVTVHKHGRHEREMSIEALIACFSEIVGGQVGYNEWVPVLTSINPQPMDTLDFSSEELSWTPPESPFVEPDSSESSQQEPTEREALDATHLFLSLFSSVDVQNKPIFFNRLGSILGAIAVEMPSAKKAEKKAFILAELSKGINDIDALSNTLGMPIYHNDKYFQTYIETLGRHQVVLALLQIGELLHWNSGIVIGFDITMTMDAINESCAVEAA